MKQKTRPELATPNLIDERQIIPSMTPLMELEEQLTFPFCSKLPC